MVKGWDGLIGGSKFEFQCGQKRKKKHLKVAQLYLHWIGSSNIFNTSMVYKALGLGWNVVINLHVK